MANQKIGSLSSHSFSVGDSKLEYVGSPKKSAEKAFELLTPKEGVRGREEGFKGNNVAFRGGLDSNAWMTN